MNFDVVEYFEQLKQSGTFLLFYQGEITENTTSELLDQLEKRIEEIQMKRSVAKKVFHICIEALQNLYHHGYKESINGYPKNFGVILLKILHDEVVLRTANIVDKPTKHFLEKRIKQFNILTKEQITKLYKIILAETSLSEKGGGGLGMIDIIKRTGDKINFSFKEVNDNMFFYIFETKLQI